MNYGRTQFSPTVEPLDFIDSLHTGNCVPSTNWSLSICLFFFVGDGFPVPREAKRLPYRV